jgi:ectoine hydroxylase-related dioxygenase (phytanoyl-CoA dioxygenase family)
MEDLAEVFDRDGVVCVRQLIDPAWVERLRDQIEETLANVRADSDRAARANKSGKFVAESSLWLRYPVFREFAFESPLSHVAAEILRTSEVRLFNDSIFVKEPGTDVRSPWHQDLPYLRITGMQTCSAWVALDDVTVDSGAVQYVAGSHRWNKLFAPIEFGTEEVRPHHAGDGMVPMPDIDAERDRYRIVSFDLHPGDVAIHNLRTVHGAPGNSSPTRRRRAFALRMAGDDVVGYDRLVGNSRADTTIVPGEPLGEGFPVLWPRVSALA